MSSGGKTLLVAGMLAHRPVSLEHGNLGNMVIMEPFFRTLRERFPESRIVTTLPLDRRFAEHAGVDVLPEPVHRSYRWPAVLTCLLALARAALWRVVRRLPGLDPRPLLTGNPLLRPIAEADAVLVFDGDMFGDNAHDGRHFVIGGSVPVLASLVGTPAYAVACSPGPFRSRLRAALARRALERCRLVATREAASLEHVAALGPGDARCRMFPCPSFGFRPLPWAPSRDEVLRHEPDLARRDRPVVGLVITDLNMTRPPAYKRHRRPDELEPFVRLVRFMVQELGVRVCIMSHHNMPDDDGTQAPGPDGRLVARLLELVPPELGDAVFGLRREYDTTGMNRVIGECEMLVSGRVHGAVQALSQGIPAAVVEYGLPPLPHKMMGFARLAGLEEYVCRPSDADAMIETVRRLWRDRERVRRHLERRVPELVAESRRLWDVVAQDLRRRTGDDETGTLYVFSNDRYGRRLRRAAAEFAEGRGVRLVCVFSASSRGRAGPVRRWLHRVLLRPRRWLQSRRRAEVLYVADVNAAAFRRRIRPGDHGIIAGFNQIFAAETIDRFASLTNVHPSVLPYYRGPVPSYWCIRNGESITGYTLHRVTPRIDDGEILFQDTVDIGELRDADELDARIAAAATTALRAYLAHLYDGAPFERRVLDPGRVYRRAVDYAGFPEQPGGAFADVAASAGGGSS